MNVFFENLLNTFLEKNYYALKKSSFSNKEKEIYKRMGFYLIKISKQRYLIYFEYLEDQYHFPNHTLEHHNLPPHNQKP